MLHCNDEWTTTRVPGPKAIDYWNEVLSDNVIELDVASDMASGFGGHIAASPLAGQAAFLISATHNQRAVHDAGGRRAGENYVLIHMRSGQMNLSASAGATRLAVGDSVLLSSTEAFRFESPECTSSLVLQFSHAWLQRWLPRADDCVGRRVAGDTSWGRTLSSALWNIEPSTVSTWQHPPADVAEQVAGLLTLALEPARKPTGRDALTARLRDIVRQRLDDPDLSPGDVAAQAGISKRYLHQLFAGTGATFKQTLLRLRLEMACRLLDNRANDGLTITAIAIHCGFADAGYFTRVFRRATGVTPSAYRRGSRPA